MHMWEMAPSSTTGRWINATTEPATNSYTALYLDGGGKLSMTAPKTAASDPYVWGAGPPVTYALSEPYGQDMTLVGPRALRLYVTSSNTNVQLFAELDDVAPDGTVSAITHGSILGSRKQTDPARSWTAPNGLPSQPYLTLDQDRYLKANQPVELDVPLQPVTWRVPKGHTLQLKLAPNAGVACAYDSTQRQGGAPVFNAPTGCILSKPMLQSLAGGVYQVLHDPTHPSALNLPLVPSDSFVTATSGVTPTSGSTALPQNWNS